MNKEKWNSMTRAEKADYIFTYYKIHIIGAVALILAIIWGIHHAMTYVDNEFFGLVVNGDELNLDRESDIREYIGMTGHSGVSLQAGLYTDEQSSGGYGSRLSILLMAGQGDFLFTDEAGVEYFKEFFGTDEVEVRDISDSPIKEYFGLGKDENYLILANLSGNQEYMKAFEKMLEDIESGKLK